VELLTSLNPGRLDPAPDYESLAPIAPIRAIAGGAPAIATARFTRGAPQQTVVQAPSGPAAELEEVPPLLAALDRLRVTQELRPVEAEFWDLQRGLRYYRRIGRKAGSDRTDEDEPPAG
jgi:hypothetical protein